MQGEEEKVSIFQDIKNIKDHDRDLGTSGGRSKTRYEGILEKENFNNTLRNYENSNTSKSSNMAASLVTTIPLVRSVAPKF